MKKLICLGMSAAIMTSAHAQINVQSDGSDGSLTVPAFTTVTLDTNQAAILPWNSAAPISGKGVYDQTQWAVVYKFNNLTLSGTSSFLKFTRHRTNAPIVILCSGNVQISAGAGIDVSATSFAAGPGGMDGAFASSGSIPNGAGFGPGGGTFTPGTTGIGGSYGTLGSNAASGLYNNSALIPLLGGSGGNSRQGFRGGGGGGAVLLGCNNTITLSGSVLANGGDAGFSAAPGSGGGIRIIANSLAGSGAISATGPVAGAGVSGGQGRIRLEVNNLSFSGNVNPSPNGVSADATPQLFPSNVHPSARIAQIGSSVVGTDPAGNMLIPDLSFTTGGPYTVQIVCNNVPTDGTWVVNLRSTPRNGQDIVLPATLVSGNQAVSLWTVSHSFAEGLTSVQVRAHRL